MNIDKTAIIGKFVKLGKNVSIGPHTVINGNVKIGDNTIIYSHCSIGEPGESIHNEKPLDPKVIIGSGTIIREGVTINSSLGDSGKGTMVGDNCYLMAKSHIGHDAEICDNAVISTGAKIGGYSIVGKYSYVGLNACTHQRSALGDYCIVGAMAFYKGEPVDGLTWAGVPARPIKVNLHNLNKNIESCEKRNEIIKIAKDYLDSVK